MRLYRKLLDVSTEAFVVNSMSLAHLDGSSTPVRKPSLELLLLFGGFAASDLYAVMHGLPFDVSDWFSTISSSSPCCTVAGR